jgi:hypothetical protein
LCLAWKKNDEHLVVMVILVLHVAFSLSSFKSSPMLSVLLSVEEFELLVIPYCHVFENHLHFLSFVNSVVLEHLLIIIKPWFQSFIISSSPTSIPSLLLPHLPHFSFYFLNRTCTEEPLQVEVYEIIFPTSHHTHETCSEQESCAYFTPAIQSVEGYFRLRSAQCFCHISLYGSSKLMILDVLERRFKGPSEYYFSSIVHL